MAARNIMQLPRYPDNVPDCSVSAWCAHVPSMFSLPDLSSGFFFWMTVVSAILFVGTLLVVPMLIVAMPADYFNRHRRREDGPPVHPAVRIAALVLKNVVGVALVAGGVVMLVLPGQGLLTIMVGLVMMDFPGKYALEKKVVSTGPVLRTMNWIRVRRGKRPLEPPEM